MSGSGVDATLGRGDTIEEFVTRWSTALADLPQLTLGA